MEKPRVKKRADPAVKEMKNNELFKKRFIKYVFDHFTEEEPKYTKLLSYSREERGN